MDFRSPKNQLVIGVVTFFLFFSAVPISDSVVFPSQKPGLIQELRILSSSFASRSLYLAAGAVSEMAASVIKLVGKLKWIAECDFFSNKECQFLSELLYSAAQHALQASLHQAPSQVCLPDGSVVSSSQQSWYLNRWNLSQVPIHTQEDKKLLHFLERRWLAKANGFYSQEIDWACPCFGIPIQVHPFTTNSYARDPATTASQTYQRRLDVWKKQLPHPEDFPLILTRPCNLREYLPSYLNMETDESIASFVERCSLQLPASPEKIIVDLTSILPKDSQNWLPVWETVQTLLSQTCKEQGVDTAQLIVIERVKQEDAGGLRLLSLNDRTKEQSDQDYRFLLQWVSTFGLTANQVELDRCLYANPCRKEFWDQVLTQAGNLPFCDPPLHFPMSEKETFLSCIEAFYDSWTSVHEQKRLMVDSVLQAVIGLIHRVSDEKWKEIMDSPTKGSVVRLSFQKMNEHLQLLNEDGDKSSFYETMIRIEQMHAHLLPLLEIFSPFSEEDFSPIYKDVLTCIPKNLKPLVSCGIHASGMTSLTGIIKAVEKTARAKPRVIYGENTYFECEHVLNQVSFAASVHSAAEEDWKEADLLLAQFCPAWKRGEAYATRYREEPIAANIRKALQARQGKPLTVALDSTLDYLDSPQISQLLLEFQKEIEEGRLNFICFRSGSKFDLFGIDSYAGAPVFMIHNPDPYWSHFDAFLNDAALQTDLLSVNWFCLAYKTLAPQLEMYRKQIFDLTRTILDKAPQKFFDKNSTYQIVPVEEGAHPSFIDIKVIGPLHYEKAAAIVCGCLYLRSIAKKFPIFYRRSLGFYHANFGCLKGDDCSSVRLTVGLDQAHVDVLVDTLHAINSLNE